MSLLLSFLIDGVMFSQESFVEMEIPTHLPVIGDTWTHDSMQYKSNQSSLAIFSGFGYLSRSSP